ncbi:hypothetical protein SAMN04515617_1408 [Collimonas sp. OK242]|uniref:hypothetical protein n=1 Tax=Collimonas sp. OK242 TaxID=1798195 RepID=UPI00089C61B7|nr:hypothetical protein [Collimonas sp. OK242]SDY97974.1 hypothetical protein SAMN04515617_1408 [Collimonas sp. OK242]
MDQNIFFVRSNTVATTLTATTFYPVFTAKDVVELNEALKTRLVLAKAVINKNSHSYNRTCIYFSIALAAYIVIAIGNDVEVDMDLAMTSLVILFAIPLARVWFLRRLLGKP